MAGAYTAKAAVVSSPDVPPGWDPDWPRPSDGFHAPFPPGYGPDYSLNQSAAATLLYSSSLAVTASLRDHTNYGTNEPIGSTLVWTATINGVAVNLKFSGDPSYSSSINSVYSDIGDFWGATPDIEFELTEENDGDTLVLQVASIVSGEELATTVDVTVEGTPVYSATVTLTWGTPTDPTNWVGSYPKTFFSAFLKIMNLAESNLAYNYGYWKKISNGGSPVFAWSSVNYGDHVHTALTATDLSASFEIPDLQDVFLGNNFKIGIRMSNASGLCDNTGSASLVIKENGVTQSTTNLTLEVKKSDPYTPTDNHDPWVTINAETGEVTVNNP